jgi:hypothetical protein
MTEQVVLLRLERRDSRLLPDQALDTMVTLDSEGVDVTLMPGRARELAASLQAHPEEDWLLLAQQARNPGIIAIAKRRILELRLVRHAVGQSYDTGIRSGKIAGTEGRLFPHYSATLFRSALKEKICSIESQEIAPELQKARTKLVNELRGYLGDEHSVPDLMRPEQVVIDTIRRWIYRQFGEALQIIDESNVAVYEAEDIARIFRLCIAITPALRETGWRVEIIKRKKNAVSVYAPERRIVVPSQRKVKPKDLAKLVVHEVFGHALRSAVAEIGGGDVCRNGTATYDTFEESFEIAMEQCLDGEYDANRGLNHYIAIGLSVTTGLPKNRIARIFTTMHLLDIGKKGINQKAIVQANRLSAAQIGRTFAGMTDVDDGIAHRKDINYLHGLNNVWTLLNYVVATGCVDTAMQWLLCAKFNPFDENDRVAASRIVPMPQQLAAFFRDNAVEMTMWDHGKKP